jgi:CRISPR-associated protein Csb2
MGDNGPRAFRWRLAGGERPPLQAALRVGMATRAAVYRGAEMRGLMPLPDAFHRGSDGAHRHAFWLAEDTDRDGRIDHAILFTPSGIPWPLLPVLAEPRRLSLADLGHWRLLPDSMGDRLPGALFGPARRWVSATAYVTPLPRTRMRAGGESCVLDAAQQLRWEIGGRKLATAPSGRRARLIELAFAPDIVRGACIVPAVGFTLKARRFSGLGGGEKAPPHWTAPPDAVQTAAALAFDRPVCGPLAFGFGAHFGLGLFEAADGALTAAHRRAIGGHD